MVSKNIIMPQLKNPNFPPNFSIIKPTNALPTGVLPVFNSAYILITLPLYSSAVLNWRVEFDLFRKVRLKNPMDIKSAAITK